MHNRFPLLHSNSFASARPVDGWMILRVRVRREDSAYAYAIIEAHEGVAVPSTAPHQEGDLTRDLILGAPVGFLAELKELIAEWATEGWAELLSETPEG